MRSQRARRKPKLHIPLETRQKFLNEDFYDALRWLAGGEESPRASGIERSKRRRLIGCRTPLPFKGAGFDFAFRFGSDSAFALAFDFLRASALKHRYVAIPPRPSHRNSNCSTASPSDAQSMCPAR